VLDGGCYAVLLNSFDDIGSHFASQERVFRERLEVAATERMPMVTHRRCQTERSSALMKHEYGAIHTELSRSLS
jgi:Tat protein secretion system quality control protein TatD with DNase activity